MKEPLKVSYSNVPFNVFKLMSSFICNDEEIKNGVVLNYDGDHICGFLTLTVVNMESEKCLDVVSTLGVAAIDKEMEKGGVN